MESPIPVQPTICTIETLHHSLKLPGPQWTEQACEDMATIDMQDPVLFHLLIILVHLNLDSVPSTHYNSQHHHL